MCRDVEKDGARKRFVETPFFTSPYKRQKVRASTARSFECWAMGQRRARARLLVKDLQKLFRTMKPNIRHAITVAECSMVIEAKNHSCGCWRQSFYTALRHDDYSIYRLINTVMSPLSYPIQGYEFWCEFSQRRAPSSCENIVNLNDLI